MGNLKEGSEIRDSLGVQEVIVDKEVRVGIEIVRVVTIGDEDLGSLSLSL